MKHFKRFLLFPMDPCVILKSVTVTKIELSNREPFLSLCVLGIQHPALPLFYLNPLPSIRLAQGDMILTRTEIKQLDFSEGPPGQPQWKSITRSQPRSIIVCCCCCCYQEQV